MNASYIEMHNFETSNWRGVVGQVLGARGDPTVYYTTSLIGAGDRW